MKKVTALILIFVMVFCIFCGCAKFNTYSVNVTGSTSFLETPVLPFYKAGDTVSFKVPILMDASVNVFVNDKSIGASGLDSDYLLYEFIMPKENVTIHLTLDQFYGIKEIQLKNLWWESDCLDREITRVSIRTQKWNDRLSFVEIRYSSKEGDIDNFRAISEEMLIPLDNYGNYSRSFSYEYRFHYTDNSEYEGAGILNFHDNFYYWYDFSSSKSFKFKNQTYVLPTIDDPELITYAFPSVGYSCDIRKYGDESFSIRFHNIDDIEFVPYVGDIIGTQAIYYLDSCYGKINLLSSTIFELDGKYYEIVYGDQRWVDKYIDFDENK